MADHDQSEKVHRKATPSAPQASAAPAMRSATTPLQSERASAARQINRSMKAWRETGGGGGSGGGVKIPTGGGAPMPGGLKQSMEKKLGADLSDVNIHTGGDSAAASKDLNARAFTTGTDVHFGSGEFNPGTKEGKKLLAHELTHVVQAKRSGISRSEDEGKEASEEASPAGEKDGEQLEVSDPNEPAEQEADAVAEKVTEDEPDGAADAKEGGEADAKANAGADADASDGAEAKGNEAEASGEEAEEQPSPIAAKAMPIAAKLRGVHRKVFRAPLNETQGRAILAEAKRITDEIVSNSGNQSWVPKVANYLIHYKPKFDQWVAEWGNKPPEGEQIKAEARRFKTCYDFIKQDCTKAIEKAIADMTAADIKKHEGVAVFNQAGLTIAKWRGHMAFGENAPDKDPKWDTLKALQDTKQQQIDEWRKVRENAANDPNLTEEQRARLKYELQLEYCQAVLVRVAANQEILHKIADFTVGRLVDGMADAIKLGAVSVAGPPGVILGGILARLVKELVGGRVDRLNLAIEAARKMNESMSMDKLKTASPEQIDELATKWQSSKAPVLSFTQSLNDIGASLKTSISLASVKEEFRKSLSNEQLKEEAFKRFLTTDVMDNTWNKIGELLGTKLVEEAITDWKVGGSETAFKLPEICSAGWDAFKAWRDLKVKEKELKSRGFSVPSS